MAEEDHPKTYNFFPGRPSGSRSRSRSPTPPREPPAEAAPAPALPAPPTNGVVELGDATGFLVVPPPAGPFPTREAAEFAALNMTVTYTAASFEGFRCGQLVASVTLDTEKLRNSSLLPLHVNVPQFAGNDPQRFYLPYVRQWFKVTPSTLPQAVGTRGAPQTYLRRGWFKLRDALECRAGDTMFIHEAFDPLGHRFFVVTVRRGTGYETFRLEEQ